MRDMNILLCTNEELMLTTIEYRFRKFGWRLDVARNLDAAREKVRRVAPDLVMVDLELPDREALAVISFLKQEHLHELPVLVAGRLDEDLRVMEALQLGADDFIISPYKPDELVLRVRRLLQPEKVAG